jgi:hypothetical protein
MPWPHLCQIDPGGEVKDLEEIFSQDEGDTGDAGDQGSVAQTVFSPLAIKALSR